MADGGMSDRPTTFNPLAQEQSTLRGQASITVHLVASLVSVFLDSYTLALEASLMGGPCQQGPWALHLGGWVPQNPDDPLPLIGRGEWSGGHREDGRPHLSNGRVSDCANLRHGRTAIAHAIGTKRAVWSSSRDCAWKDLGVD